MRFNKSECKVQHLGRGNLQYQYRLGMKGLRAALLRKAWGYWWMKSWTWATSVRSQPRKPTISWATSKEAWPAGRGRGFYLCSGETSPGVLCPALEPSAQERHGPVGLGPGEDHKKDPRAGTPFLWGKAERVWAFQPGEGPRDTLLQPSST